MNTKYRNNPELIARLRTVNRVGDDIDLGEKVTGIQILQNDQNPNGVAQIDVHDFKRGVNLLVEIELCELSAAISLATLNAERD